MIDAAERAGLAFCPAVIDAAERSLELDAQANGRRVGTSLLKQPKRHARRLQAETFALDLAARDPRTPCYAKVLVAGVVAYAFSPIDLIPDFVPVPGYLDDLIVLPLGIALAIRLVPRAALSDCRARAATVTTNGKPAGRAAAAVIVPIWLGSCALGVLWAQQAFVGGR